MPSDWQLRTNYGKGYPQSGSEDCVGWCICCCCCAIIAMFLIVF